MLVIFGLPGAGKSEVGKRISKSRGLFHLEADFLRDALAALNGLTTPERFRITFSDICSVARENSHLSDRFLVTGAMPEKWQWDLLRSAVCEETKIRCVYLECPVSVCLKRLAERETDEKNQYVKHSFATLQSLSNMYEELGSEFFKNSVDATKPSNQVAAEIEAFLDGR